MNQTVNEELPNGNEVHILGEQQNGEARGEVDNTVKDIGNDNAIKSTD